MMSQSDEFGEVWSHLRDNARPVTPRDAKELAYQRNGDYAAPSRAHIKRLARPRPEIVPATPERPRTFEGKALAILKALNAGREFRHMRNPPRPEKPAPPPQVQEVVITALLADLRTPRQKALARLSRGPEGPDVCPALARRILHVNQQMAVQFGPWPRRVQALAYEVIHV